MEYPYSKTDKMNLVMGSTTICLPLSLITQKLGLSRFVVARFLRHASFYRRASSSLTHLSTSLPVAPPPSIGRHTRSRVEDNVEEAIYELKRTSRERCHKFDKTISNFGFKKKYRTSAFIQSLRMGYSSFLCYTWMIPY